MEFAIPGWAILLATVVISGSSLLAWWRLCNTVGRWVRMEMYYRKFHPESLQSFEELEKEL
jgi:hypothetical protein